MGAEYELRQRRPVARHGTEETRQQNRLACASSVENHR
jgi:hypothetical protein